MSDGVKLLTPVGGMVDNLVKEVEDCPLNHSLCTIGSTKVFIIGSRRVSPK